MLVFLPGIGEIRRVEQLLTDRVGSDVDVRLLAGALSLAEQDLALMPSPTGRRRVVLSTDIAESSLTVSGVRIVVDAGLARVPRHDLGSGMTRLTTVSTSRASADQRAGRAGRTEPGVAYRLWSKLEHATRRAHLEAEITQVDLAGVALELATWGTPIERAAVHRSTAAAGPAAGARVAATPRSARWRWPPDDDRASDAGAAPASTPGQNGRRRHRSRHGPRLRRRRDPRRARRAPRQSRRTAGGSRSAGSASSAGTTTTTVPTGATSPASATAPPTSPGAATLMSTSTASPPSTPGPHLRSPFPTGWPCDDGKPASSRCAPAAVRGSQQPTPSPTSDSSSPPISTATAAVPASASARASTAPT